MDKSSERPPTERVISFASSAGCFSYTVPSYRTSVAYHFIHNAPPFRRNASSPAAVSGKKIPCRASLSVRIIRLRTLPPVAFFVSASGFLPKGRHHAAHRFIHVCIVAASIIVNAARQFSKLLPCSLRQRFTSVAPRWSVSENFRDCFLSSISRSIVARLRLPFASSSSVRLSHTSTKAEALRSPAGILSRAPHPCSFLFPVKWLRCFAAILPVGLQICFQTLLLSLFSEINLIRAAHYELCSCFSAGFRKVLRSQHIDGMRQLRFFTAFCHVRNRCTVKQHIRVVIFHCF